MTEPQDPKQLYDELCRQDFSVFLRRAWPAISGGEQLQWNWHLDALCHQLDRVARGECQRLIVNIPPRNGKSKTVSSIWAAWRLGRDPTTSIVGVSYSNELSGKLARDCLAIMQLGWYRELFPRAVISQRRSASHDFDLVAGGGRLATSVTGTLTGRGGDLILLDDIIKPEEANSEHAREGSRDWFRGTLASRLNDKRSGAIVVIMQRLHEDDLTGMLLEAGGWDHFCVPSIAIEDEIIPLTRGRAHFRRRGDILHPQREPIEVLEQLRASMGSIAFAAQYQQDPVPAVGNMIRAEWLQTYDPARLDMSRGMIVQSWDTASKDNPHNDFSVCVTALVWQKRVYILDVFRKRLQFPELRAHVIRLAREYGAHVVLIEDQSSGSQLIQTLMAESPQGVPEPIGRRPELDKVARVAGISVMIELRQLLLPDDAPWLGEFRSELLAFPNARFDDQVDALSQLMIWMRDRDRFDAGSGIGAPIYVGSRGELYSPGGSNDWLLGRRT